MQRETYSVVHCTEKRIKTEFGETSINWDNVGIVWDYRTKKISPIPTYAKDEWVERFALVNTKTFKPIILGSCQTREGVWEPIHFHFIDE